ncbi:MAG: TIGR04190 family B12-binding domain/radical SAM domain protein [Chloroflexi bacterium]|nr:TIGR04190 family B12-binding domain/radical SAM domain protein [Chloroflexota bacterium]
MPRSDLILIHAPSVYDFRQKTILYGPISDLIPSTPVFEMYPIGFTSIAEYLGRFDYHVRIVNLAVRMLNDPSFDADRQIMKLKAPVFGVDLHWLPHAHGAIEVARLIKRHHPESAVVMGGISSSYFYSELIQYPEVDYVLRGDSTEEPLRQLMDCVTKGGDLAFVPNLVWKDAQGAIQENPLSYIPYSLDDVMSHHYEHTIRSVIRYADLANYIPFKRWMSYPISAIFTCRGCTKDCVFCGGSKFAFRRLSHRTAPAYRSPEVVARDVTQMARLSRGPMFILGDIRQAGEDYADRLLHVLKSQKPGNQFILELFSPASREFLRQVGEACPGFNLEISMESHDPTVREATGKHYTNGALEETVRYALEAGCKRVDVFFMIGLPKQTFGSIMGTIDYCGQLMERWRSHKPARGTDEGKVFPFISPLAPFVDPGSLAFEQPDLHGYRIRFRSLEEHRQALLSPSWKYMLNYETNWLSRDEIVASSYEAGLRLNRLKARYGLISEATAQATESRASAAIRVIERIDKLVAQGDETYRDEELRRLKIEVDELSMSTVCEKRELELPVGLLKLNPLRAAWALLSGR